MVILPDSQTGQPEEIYLADPFVLPEISDTYDLAVLVIYDNYIDEEGTIYGSYPREFPSFEENESCSIGEFKLGESIRIFGYPEVSGGMSLTITEGVISSFTEGYILTSAKIDSGNSGGLAVSEEGCSVGIPSAVNVGTYQNLGVIIPNSVIDEFLVLVFEKINETE